MNDIFPTTHVRHKEFAHGPSIFDSLFHTTPDWQWSARCVHTKLRSLRLHVCHPRTPAPPYTTQDGAWPRTFKAQCHHSQGKGSVMFRQTLPQRRRRPNDVKTDAVRNWRGASSLQTLHWLEVLTTSWFHVDFFRPSQCCQDQHKQNPRHGKECWRLAVIIAHLLSHAQTPKLENWRSNPCHMLSATARTVP